MAGGIFTGLGRGLQSAASTYLTLKKDEKDRAEQSKRDAIQQMLANDQTAASALSRKLTEAQIAELPKKNALDDVDALGKLLGEGKYDSPEFVAALDKAGIQLPKREGGISNIAALNPSKPDYSVAPHTGVILPPEVQDSQRQRDFLNKWLEGDSGASGSGGGLPTDPANVTAMDRAMYGKVFKRNPNEAWGPPEGSVEGSDFRQHFNGVVKEEQAKLGRKLTLHEANKLREDTMKHWDTLKDRPYAPVTIVTDQGVFTRDPNNPNAPITPVKTAAGGPAQPQATGATRTMQEGAAMLSPHIEDVNRLAQELDKRGLFGPVMSRVRDAMTKIGTFNPGKDDPDVIDTKLSQLGDALVTDPSLQTDELAGEFATALSLLASGAGRVHGGARGGGSIQMISYLKNMLSAEGTYPMFHGRMRALNSYISSYAKGPVSGATPGGANPPAAAPGVQWTRDKNGNPVPVK